MGEIIYFFTMHPLLSLALIASLLLVLMYEVNQRSLNLNSITTQQAVILMNKNAKIFDLRSLDAFSKGFISGAKNSPSSIDNNDPKINKLKERSIILVCNTGISAAKEATRLNKEGFKQVYVLKGGMAEWESQRLPVEK